MFKLACAFTIFNAVIANNEVIVVFKPNQRQLELMQTNEGDLIVRRELSEPLSKEQLEELREATGVELFDRSPIGLGGRVLSTDNNLSAGEMESLLTKLNQISWVKYAQENRVMDTYDRDKLMCKSKI